MDPAHNHGDSSQMNEMMMHPMSFHFGSDETILFGFWKIQTAIGLIISFIVIVGLCFLMEFVRWFRLLKKKNQSVADMNNANNLPQQTLGERINCNLVIGALLHGLQLTLGYMLMLIFMTFNVWLCLAVVFGEVAARVVIFLFFPQLDLVSQVLANAESCCG